MADLLSQSGPIGRHFCQVGGQWLHYRRMGQGPAVLLMHQTPQSSQTLEPLMRLLAPYCTAIAVDTPGFGQSEPLPQADWSMAMLADRTAMFLDALGIAEVSVAGQHTGAAIAVELARRHPQRVRALALDGLPLFNAAEQSSILPHQLYRFVPQVDGTHLMWAWSRFRDGWMFFPWSQRDLAHRRQLDFPEPALIHSWQIMELLRSRESHLRIYPGVFAWDGIAAIGELSQPTWVGTPADDQLYPHMQRLPAGLPHVTLQTDLPIGSRSQVLQAQARWVLDHAGGDDAPQPPALSGGQADTRRYVQGLLVQGWQLDRSGPATLLLHAAGSSGACEMRRHALEGPVLAVDLPGHGDSDGPVLSCEEAARKLGQVLKELDLPALQVRARGYGAAVAAHWALQCAAARAAAPPCRPLELQLHEVPGTAARAQWHASYAKPIVPVWDGTHLIALWHELRDRELFHPWFERQRENIRTVEPQIDAASLTQALFAALQCQDWARAHRHWLDWDPHGPLGLAALEASGAAVKICAQADDGWAAGLGHWLEVSDGPSSGGSQGR
jgi:pimeloyl-ACP methyl ester carboxylesterase